MKKFLSILLALAVGFTFTFGSAMSAFAAATATEKADAYTSAMNYADSAVNAKCNAIKISNAAKYDATAIESALNVAKTKAEIFKIDAANVAMGNDTDGMAGTGKLAEFTGYVDTWITGPGSNTGVFADDGALKQYKDTSFNSVFLNAVVDYDLAAKKDKATALINSIDVANYVADSQNAVTEAINVAKEALKNVEKTSGLKPANTLLKKADDATNTDYTDAINAILYGYKMNEAKATATYATEVYTEKTKTSVLPKVDSDTTFVIAGLFGKLAAEKTLSDKTADDAVLSAYSTNKKANLAWLYNNDIYNAWKVERGDVPATKFVSIGIGSPTKKLGDIVVVDTTNKTVLGVPVADVNAALTADEATKINAEILNIFAKFLDVANACFDAQKISGAIDTEYAKMDEVNEASAAIDWAFKGIATYESYEAKADVMKTKVYIDGTKMYNNEDIDKALEKDKKDIYSKCFADNPSYTNNLDKVNAVDPVWNAIKTAIAKFYKDYEARTPQVLVTSGANKTADADKVYLKDTYSVEAKHTDWAEIADDAVEALEEAKTLEEVDSIMADAAKKLAELRTAEQYRALDTALIGKYKEALTEYIKSYKKLIKVADYPANAFADLAAYYQGNDDDAFIAPTYTSADNNNFDSLGAFDLVKDNAAVAALYEEAKAAVANVKTTKALNAEADKVEALLAALPATATVADETKFMEAYDAYKAYLENYGAAPADITGYYVFLTKMDALQTAQEKAVADAVAKLPKVITTADKDAVEAVRAMYDKYYDYYDQYEYSRETDGALNAFSEASLDAIKTAERTLSLKQIAEVEQKIAALNENSTANDIKAARAAYDALSGSQQRAIDAGYLYKLTEAEKLVGVSDADAKAYVQDLSIAVRTAKVGKKVKVTVKADVQKLVDNGFTVEYKFYKSTKKGSGYKNTVNKTTNTYTNTNPVKGKNYYKVKLVVKNADGTVVATTPLTQCKYGVRTIK